MPEKFVNLLPSEFYPFCAQPAAGNRESRNTRGERWSGTSNYDEALKLAQTGWPEGSARARKLADHMSAELVSSLKRPEIIFDTTGDMFDMGRVIEDCPESWMAWEEGQEDGGKPVHIVLNCSVSAGISTDLIELRGTAVCALAIVLESAGRPVKIEIGAGIRDSDATHFEPRVVVKDFYDPIQIDACAYALIHPSFFRRHIFSALEVMGLKDRFGYGNVAVLRGTHGDLHLGGAQYGDSQWRNEQTSIEWIKEQLINQGVTFSGDNR